MLQNYTIFLGLSDFTKKKIKRGFKEDEILGSEWVKSFVKLIQLSIIIVPSIFPTFYKNLRSLTTFPNKIRETKALISQNFCKCLSRIWLLCKKNIYIKQKTLNFWSKSKIICSICCFSRNFSSQLFPDFNSRKGENWSFDTFCQSLRFNTFQPISQTSISIWRINLISRKFDVLA